ncbi:helix-turn-helix domain-containing protein [Sphingobacterium sp. BN32]|uniref:helix-turn-helix domain-containing protein n=1 Tax=Sphingobacterium sp. BN32 TaxID=3058432 RepID=UPI00265CE6D1|nr:helix-turn-helix domain-containing protein [Sphingobacterium sp. BN32]WKK59833.1 hypothetical protein QYC40_06225 [Sphingobacterium sp. BN32]
MKSLLLQTKISVEKVLTLLTDHIESQRRPEGSGFDTSEKKRDDRDRVILYDAHDVRRILRIERSTYYRWVKSGLLKPIQIMGKHYYTSRFIEDVQRAKGK